MSNSGPEDTVFIPPECDYCPTTASWVDDRTEQRYCEECYQELFTDPELAELYTADIRMIDQGDMDE